MAGGRGALRLAGKARELWLGGQAERKGCWRRERLEPRWGCGFTALSDAASERGAVACVGSVASETFL